MDIFSTSKPVEFGRQIRKIRERFNLSQQNVFEETGISVDTLRRLENGQSIPKIDTLNKMSALYRTDMIALYGKYQQCSSLLSLYQTINILLSVNKKAEVVELIQAFRSEGAGVEELFDQRDIEQVGHYLNGIEKRIADPKDPEAFTDYCHALKVYYPDFSLANWEDNTFNVVELRILFSIACYLNDFSDYTRSEHMLLFILDRMDLSWYADYAEKILITNLYAELTYLYHRRDAFESVLTYADQAVRFCTEHHLVSNLPLLLYRKGHAMIQLKQSAGIDYIDKAIDLLNVFGYDELSQIYQKQKHKLMLSLST